MLLGIKIDSENYIIFLYYILYKGIVSLNICFNFLTSVHELSAINKILVTSFSK